jgi:enamine deaminase RidA (YjgF/YER057c/UK114 family)
VRDDVREQARRCFDIISGALHELGSSLDQVVRTRMFVTSSAHADAVGEVHGEAMAKARPVATMVVVKELIDPRWHVEIEVEALATA